MPRKSPNKALQTDKDNLSCLLHSQKPRQLVFAAELSRLGDINVDLATVLPRLLPRAIEWAESESQEILRTGAPLSDLGCALLDRLVS
jgi:hypothetical protein